MDLLSCDDEELLLENLARAAVNTRSERLATHAIGSLRGSSREELAMHYAATLGRPHVAIDENGVFAPLPHGTRSLTLFVSSEHAAAYEWVVRVRSRLDGYRLPLALMVGGDLAQATQFAARQLPYLATTGAEPTSSWREVPDVGSAALSAAAMARELVAPVDTMVLGGHSRPHCGCVKAADGLVAICGSPTRGEQGRCFASTACELVGLPIVPLDRVAAPRLFFNSCSTGRLAGTSYGLPAEAQLTVRAIGGGADQYIANHHAGRYTAGDGMWLAALSALRYSPAKAAVIVQEVRRIEQRQQEEACFFFGDGASLPWPAPAYVAVTGEKSQRDGELQVRWDRPAAILVARIDGAEWGRLAARDELDLLVAGDRSELGLFAGGVVVDPFSGDTLLMVTATAERLDLDEAVTARLVPRARPVSRAVGSDLAWALREIGAFATTLPYRSLEPELVESARTSALFLRRFATSRDSIVDLEPRLGAALLLERSLCDRIDASLVQAAAGVSGRWNWQEEYLHFVDNVPSQERLPPCNLCGAPVVGHRTAALLDADVARLQRICVDCGIVSDLPEWPLLVQLQSTEDAWDGATYRDALIVENRSGDEVRLHVAPHVQMAVLGDSSAPPPAVVSLRGYERRRLPFALTFEQRPPGFTWVRVYVASGGRFGFTARPFVF